MATKTKRVKKAPKQRPINAVPLTKEQQRDVDKFLHGINTDGAEALVIVLRNAEDNGTVDANVLNAGLTDELANKMANAALKSINGQPLFTTWG